MDNKVEDNFLIHSRALNFYTSKMKELAGIAGIPSSLFMVSICTIVTNFVGIQNFTLDHHFIYKPEKESV